MFKKRNEKRTARYTYADCLRDIAPVPTGVNGTTLYQLLAVGGSATLVTTGNGLRSSGIDFVTEPH